MLIDTHCHLTFGELLPQVGEVLERAAAAGVKRVVTVATDPADAEAALGILRDHSNVYLAAGVHPHEAGKVSAADLDGLASLHRERPGGDLTPRLVAVGEMGLDFHYDFAPRERQEEVFRFQLELACEVNRPVVIHARAAEPRVCDILADYPALAERVVFHCYSGDLATARRIIEMGFWISFTGIVTFKNAEEIRNAARLVPADRIMVETDAPYLSPAPVRKIHPNEPAFVSHTARFLAVLRNESFESFAADTTANAERFFSLPRDAS